MPKTLRPLSYVTLNHQAALVLLDEAVARIAAASRAGFPRIEVHDPALQGSAGLSIGSAKLARIRTYLERHDTPFLLGLPRAAGERLPRLTPALRLLNLKLSPERAAILAKTAAERKQFASVPSMLCCIALPASEVMPPPHVWVAWAGLYNLPIPMPRISKLQVNTWRAWALDHRVKSPDLKVAHSAEDWVAWARSVGAPLPAPHVSALTLKGWRKLAAAQGIAAPEAHTYTRVSGRKKLEMTSSPTLGCPYGIYPRRLMVGIATRVKQMQQNKIADSHIVHLGDTPREAIRILLNADYNVGGTAGKRFLDQFHRLINSHILWWTDTDYKYRYVEYDFLKLDRGEPLSPEMEKHLLFRVKGLTLILGQHFHADCLRAAPIDYGIFDKLAAKGGCLAVDIYLWLTFKAWLLKNTRRVEMDALSWDSLSIQFGGTYESLRNFRKEFKRALNLVQSLYPKMEWRETENPSCKSVLSQRIIITLKEPSVQCAYTGLATGTGGPRFRQATLLSGNLFEE